MPKKQTQQEQDQTTALPVRDQLADQIERAHRSGKYLVLTVCVEGDRVYCDRLTHSFPTADLAIARSLVESEFEKIAAEQEHD